MLMRRAYCARWSGDWENYLEEFLGNGKIGVWASVKVRDCISEVEQEDEGWLSIAQAILRKSTDFLRRIIAPVDGMGGVTLSYVCPHCHCFPLDGHIWSVSSGHGDVKKKKKKKQCNWWCAACGGHYDWRAPNKGLGRQGLQERGRLRPIRRALKVRHGRQS